MKAYRFFHPWWMSFYSKLLYRDVGKNWRGIAATYLLILLTICWLPLFFKFHAQINYLVQNELPPLVNQLPTITIVEGKVSINKPVPYRIKNPDDGQLIALIDTSGKVKSLAQTDAKVLLTKNELLVRKNAAEIRSYDLSNVKEMTINQAIVNSFLKKLLMWAAVFAFPVVVLGAFLYRLVQALLYGAIGMLFSKISRVSLQYQQSIRLSVIAVTPAIILSTLFEYFGFSFPYQGLSYFLLTMVFLFFGVRAQSD